MNTWAAHHSNKFCYTFEQGAAHVHCLVKLRRNLWDRSSQLWWRCNRASALWSCSYNRGGSTPKICPLTLDSGSLHRLPFASFLPCRSIDSCTYVYLITHICHMYTYIYVYTDIGYCMYKCNQIFRVFVSPSYSILISRQPKLMQIFTGAFRNCEKPTPFPFS